MYRIFIFIILLGCWMVFSGLFDAFHLTLGVLSAGFVTWISSDLFFEDRSQTAKQRLLQFVRAPAYVFWLLKEIVDSNIHVLKLALTKDGPKRIKPSILRWKTPLKSDFSKYVLANSITLTPGTVTIKIENGDEFLIHAISRRTAKAVDGSMDRRIAAVYEPDNPDCRKEAEE